MVQFVYCWLDKELGITKIGKTNTWTRFLQRVREAITSNIHLTFVGVWRCDFDPKKIDAGEFAARELQRVKAGSRAREWFRPRSGPALTTGALNEMMTEKFGVAIASAIPDSIFVDPPWDVFGNRPKPGGLSRLWIHEEKRPSRLLKLSDNSWWTPNLRPSWINTFNPAGFELLGGYEWQNLPSDRSTWPQLNDKARAVKVDLTERYGVSGLPRVAQIGWLSCKLEILNDALCDHGFAPFDPAHGIRPGVLGQDELS